MKTEEHRTKWKKAQTHKHQVQSTTTELEWRRDCHLLAEPKNGGEVEEGARNRKGLEGKGKRVADNNRCRYWEAEKIDVKE